jgi:hypothetical protein
VNQFKFYEQKQPYTSPSITKSAWRLNMTFLSDQSDSQYPESSNPNVFYLKTPVAAINEGTVESDTNVALFQLEEWNRGITQAKYNDFVSALSVMDRESLYQDVLKTILSGLLGTKCLLVFAGFDPHRKLVSAAVKDYLANQNPDINDEYACVHDLIEVLAESRTANRGAILAGLVAVGDRKINALARASRHLLSSYDIRNFSAVHRQEIRSSSVEFCLDWLVELNQSEHKDHASDIAYSLMLMIVHDERGIIEDLSEIEYVKFRKSKTLKTKTFESYYSEIRPILNYLQKCDGFESIIGKVIEMWDGHQAKARLLQEK